MAYFEHELRYRRFKNLLDDVCEKIARAFNLFDSRGHPRKALILTELLRHSCLGCIAKNLIKSSKERDIDAIYLENHKFALNLLTERLLNFPNIHSKVHLRSEVLGEYGRVDLLIESEDIQIIVEVKTGKGFSYAQIFRYLIERPHATIVVWRVMMHQTFSIRGIECFNLTLACMDMAIRRGLALLNASQIPLCNHRPLKRKGSNTEKPQEIVDRFIQAVIDDLPNVIRVILCEIEALKQSQTIRRAR